MQRSRPHHLLWLCLWFCGCCLSSFSLAGTGAVAELPLAFQASPSGLKLEIDTTWVDGNGYRPIKVKLSQANGGVAKTTRTIRVKLIPYHWKNRARAASAWVELPQGKTEGVTYILVPQSSVWWNLNVETYEGGRRIPELTSAISVVTVGNYEWTEATPCFLFIDADADSDPNVRPGTADRLPDVRGLLSHFYDREGGRGGKLAAEHFNLNKTADDDTILDLISRTPRAMLLPPTAIPTKWLHLSSVEWIVISLDDLTTLREDKPRFEAVRRLVSAGAVLCVYGVGERFERLAELERLVELTPLPAGAEDETRGWTEPDPAGYRATIEAVESSRFGVRNGERKHLAIPQRPYPFVWRNAESGCVIALRSENPFRGQPADWAWIFNSLPEERWMWFARYGMSMNRDNDDYWNLMVPGVGAAPVNSFMVLITVFVIAVGPVVYALLRRWHRLQLLLLVVPTTAGIVTTALFLYALLDDGLAVRARLRTVTTIDQQNDRVATWARHAYYAGLAPSAGLIYPADAVVHPLDNKPSRVGGPQRHTFWLDRQHLDVGYLRSRTMAQMMVVRPGQTKAGLEFSLNGSRWTVTNQLGVRIRRLVARDEAGNLGWAEDIDPAATAPLSAEDEVAARAGWLTALDRDSPGYPPGFSAADMENAASMFDVGWSMRIDSAMDDPQTKTSWLERALSAARNWDDLPPRSYLAIVERAVDLELATDTAGEEASLHLVRGSW